MVHQPLDVVILDMPPCEARITIAAPDVLVYEERLGVGARRRIEVTTCFTLILLGIEPIVYHPCTVYSYTSLLYGTVCVIHGVVMDDYLFCTDVLVIVRAATI